MVSLAERRSGVDQLEMGHGISERRAYQVAEIPRSTKRRPGKSTTTVDRSLYPNHVSSYDFVADQTADGRRLRFLNSNDVVRVLEQLVEIRGVPGVIKSDNGPELVRERVQDWLSKRGIATKLIDPGSPWHNGHNESFNGVFRDGCLNRWLFVSVLEARLVVERWRQEYNQERPHGALGQITPAAYRAGVERQEKRVAA